MVQQFLRVDQERDLVDHGLFVLPWPYGRAQAGRLVMFDVVLKQVHAILLEPVGQGGQVRVELGVGRQLTQVRADCEQLFLQLFNAFV